MTGDNINENKNTDLDVQTVLVGMDTTEVGCSDVPKMQIAILGQEEKCKKENSKYRHKWRKNNLEKCRETERKYRELNRKKYNEWARKSRAKHAERIRNRQRKWVKDNREHTNFISSKSRWKMLGVNKTNGCLFGIEDYIKLFQSQDGCCAICGKRNRDPKKKLAVDHDHKTNTARGLLCINCNLKLGVLEDEKFNIGARDYLSRFLLR